MKLQEAVSKRIRNILKDRNMTQYRLEQLTGIPHGSMNRFINCRYNSCNLKTIALIAEAFNLSLSEFFNDPIFESEEIDLD